MDLQINQREKDGIRILDLQGRLIFGESEAKLREAMRALANDGIVKVILNLAQTNQIDEDGLGALIICNAGLQTVGGALKLVNFSPRHMNPALLMKQDTVLEVFKDEQDAVNSFFPDRAVRHYDILEFVEKLEKHPPTKPPE
jgi:anti-sigma B factor antagonist